MGRARSTVRKPAGYAQVSGRLPAVKALTIRQPWAWATIYGGKDLENRRWRRPGLWIPPAAVAERLAGVI